MASNNSGPIETDNAMEMARFKVLSSRHPWVVWNSDKARFAAPATPQNLNTAIEDIGVNRKAYLISETVAGVTCESGRFMEVKEWLMRAQLAGHPDSKGESDGE